MTYPDADDAPVEEESDLYSPYELARLLAFILSTQPDSGKEMLKPLKLARTSARTFWNLILHFGDVEAGLRAIFPRLDWYDSFFSLINYLYSIL